MNGFGREGADAIGKALKTNRTLLELNLYHNRIPENGVQSIANGLQTNDALKILKVT